MRCLALAHALKAQGEKCHFVSREHPGNMTSRIEAEGFPVVRLPAPKGAAPKGPPKHAGWAGVDWEQDAEQTRAAIGAKCPDWIVLDHYAFDARWQHAVRPVCARVMVIDDLADRPHKADLLLDQNLGRSTTDYDGLVHESCQRLIGPRYALLRPEFAAARAQALTSRSGRGLKHLLISMGGVDSPDATSAVLSALQSAPLPEGLRITVIMGSNAPALDRVRALAQEIPRPTEVVVDVTDMAARMAAADLAVGAAGATTWERCCVGLPSIVATIADNQTGITQAMESRGAVLDVGRAGALDFTARLQEAIAQARDPGWLAVASNRACGVCDGDGVGRVLKELCPTIPRFRDAGREDSRRMWEWRSADDNKFRFGGEITPYRAHDEWLLSALQSPERILRVLLLGHLPCGYVRLDHTEAARARVSICLARDVRGAGLGKTLLNEADRLGKSLMLEGLDAEIHPDNTASRKLFTTAGYAHSGEQHGFLTFHRELESTT